MDGEKGSVVNETAPGGTFSSLSYGWIRPESRIPFLLRETYRKAVLENLPADPEPGDPVIEGEAPR